MENNEGMLFKWVSTLQYGEGKIQLGPFHSMLSLKPKSIRH